MKRSKIIFLSLAILLVVALSVSLSFYILNNQTIIVDEEVEVLVIIDFGTLTSVDNYIQQTINITEGQSAFFAFSLVAELTTKNDSLLGVYVEGVNGYMESGDYHWFFFYYDINQESWSLAPVGVSHYYLYEGDRIKLAYSG